MIENAKGQKLNLVDNEKLNFEKEKQQMSLMCVSLSNVSEENYKERWK